MPRRGNPTDFESFLTWEALVDVLSYDPATGEFRWVKPGRLGWVGRLAGTVDYSGYRRIEILGRSFYAARLAWLYMKKRWHGAGWRVWFSVNRKGVSLGTFATLAEAVSARDEYLTSRPEYLNRRA